MHVWESALPIWQKTNTPFELDVLLHDAPGQDFSIVPRDLDILDSLLKHRFLTTQQLGRLHFTSESRAKRRVKRLYDAGVVMRYRPLMPKGSGTAPFIYTLTQMGFELLTHTRYDYADVEQNFYREDAQIVELTRIMHELELNEFCLDFIDEVIKYNVRWDWLPTKLCRQQIPLPGGRYMVVEPDAILSIFTPQGELVIHIEYERSADMRRFRQKLSRWRDYRKSQHWRGKYSKEPYIVVVGKRNQEQTGGRKRRVVGSIELLQSIALEQKFPNISFFPLEEKQAGGWRCLPERGEEKSLWSAIGLDSQYFVMP